MVSRSRGHRWWKIIRGHAPNSSRHGCPAVLVAAQDWTRAGVIMGLAQKNLPVGADNLVEERTGSGLKEQMEAAGTIDLGFWPAEGNQRSGREHPENLAFAHIGHAHIKHQSLQIVGLLKGVFAAFGRT